MERKHLWLIVHRVLGLAWIGATGPQVVVMLVAGGWLPSLALAFWQVRHRRLRSLLLSDLLGGGALPLVLLPRGVLSELLVRSLPARRNSDR